LTFRRKFYDSAQLVVPIAKDVGLDFEFVLDNPFDRIPAALNLGIHILNGNPRFGPPPRVQTLTSLATRGLPSRSSGRRALSV